MRNKVMKLMEENMYVYRVQKGLLIGRTGITRIDDVLTLDFVDSDFIDR